MFSGMDSYQITFWVCAVLGTTFFILKAAVALLGGIDHDLDADGGAGHEVAHEGDDSSDAAFKVFSITSLTGFFMMFGWVGLAAYDDRNMGSTVSLLAAFIAGLGTMYVTALIFRGARKLAGGGANFDINQSIGEIGNVYQRIPAAGKGRIQIVLAGTTHEIDAMSEEGRDLESFTNVKVVRVVNNDTVSVKGV